MIAQVYSVSGQTEGRKKVFLEWTSIDLLSSTLSLTCGVNVNYYKSVHHSISTLPVGIGNTKQISELSFQLSVRVYSLLGHTEEETKAFFGGCKKGSRIVRLTTGLLVVIRDEKVCPFVTFEIILPLLCCLLDPAGSANKHYRAWSSMINLWIDSRICQKYRILLSAKQGSNNYLELSKENVFGNLILSH